MLDRLDLHIEALIFASEQSIGKTDLKAICETAFERPIEEKEIITSITAIKEKYDSPNLTIELVEVANGYLFLTKKDFHTSINQLHLHRAKKKLSQAAIETLAIIAYRQPITKLEIEQIRGVNCDYTVQKLLEKELISLAGKADTVGKPILYQTSDLFMDYFGLKNLADLPQMKDFISEVNEVGKQQD